MLSSVTLLFFIVSSVAALAQNCWNCHFNDKITLVGALQDSSKDKIDEYVKKDMLQHC